MITLLSSLIGTVGFATSLDVPNSCPVMEVVPSNAEIVRTHGIDFAVFPSRKLPQSFTGCQYVWMGDADEPGEMTKLSIAYFKEHQLQWIIGEQPDEPPFKCIYERGELVVAKSENSKLCPTAASLEKQ